MVFHVELLSPRPVEPLFEGDWHISAVCIHVDLLCVPSQQVTGCSPLLALQPNTTHATAKRKAELASNCILPDF